MSYFLENIPQNSGKIMKIFAVFDTHYHPFSDPRGLLGVVECFDHAEAIMAFSDKTYADDNIGYDTDRFLSVETIKRER